MSVSYLPTTKQAATISTPGYVLDAGTVSNPTTANVLNVSSATPVDIPLSYGRRAIFGCVIWSGNFKVVNGTSALSTFCDFAVAFGYPGTPKDEISEIKLARLWIEPATTLGAGAQLIFDRTTPGGFVLSADLDITIYDGSEDQTADELIAKTEGAVNTPPFRGMIYVVFKNFNLAKYGLTTVPQLRAEIVDISNPVNYFVPFEEDGIFARDTLTFTTRGSNGQTVTIDGHVYTLVSGNANAANKVHIGDNISGTISNLVHAINATGTAGNTTYGVGTIAHATVTASAGMLAATMVITARTSGTAGNAIVVSDTISGSWSSTHLSGALSDNIGLPQLTPIGVDWQRNRSYFVSLDSGHYTLRIYDMTGMREIIRGAIKNEHGTPVPYALLNVNYLWQVDEVTGTIYTTYGGTANNVQMVAINPNTQRIFSRNGKISLGFPNVTSNTLSFPVRMRFASSTLGYGPCQGTRRYAVVATIYNQIYMIGIGAKGELGSPFGITSFGTTLDIDHLDFSNNITGLVVQSNVFTSTYQPIDDSPLTTTTFGIRAFTAAGTKLYFTIWMGLFPFTSPPTTGVAATIPTGAFFQKLVWNQSTLELFAFYQTAAGVNRLRRYMWIINDSSILEIRVPNVFQLMYDVIVPEPANGAFEVGAQYSKVEMGTYGYISFVAGKMVAVVLNTKDGTFKTYPMEDYVVYNTDFAANEEASPTGFEFGLTAGEQPYCPSAGYFVCRPISDGGAITAGLMYVDGILNFRVPLASLLRWLCMSAGYEASQIYVDPAIDDKVIGSIIDQQTDIFQLIQALGIVFNFNYFESEELIKFVRPPSGVSMPISAALTIDNIAPTQATDNVIDQESLIITMDPADSVPDSVALTFLDFTNDYQASTVTAIKTFFPFSAEKDSLADGAQHFSQKFNSNNNQASYSIPIIMLPSEAISDIYKALYLQQIQRLKAQFRSGFEFMLVEPVDAVTLNVNDIQYNMSVYETTLNDDYSISMGAMALATEDVNIPTIEDDLTSPTTIVGSYLTDLVVINSALFSSNDQSADPTSLLVYVVAYGYNDTWPGATIYYSIAGATAQPVLNVLQSSVVGHMVSDIIDTGMEHFTDETASIDVQMLAPVSLISVSDDDILDDANLALIGNTDTWEIIQYRDVVDNSNGSYTLSAIVRGRRNTEHNMGSHTSGDYFIPITGNTIFRQTIPQTAIGQNIAFEARNINQQQGLTIPQEWIVEGTSIKPWSPADYSVVFDTDHFVISWARRTKEDAPLMDGTGAVPLEYLAENFEIDIYDQHTNQVVQTIQVTGVETTNYLQATYFTDAFPHKAHDLTVANPGAELFMASWTSSTGALGTSFAITNTGSRCFSNTISPMLAYQTISIDASFNTLIDAGLTKVLISWYQDGNSPDVAATGAMDAAFYDGSSALISTATGAQQHFNSSLAGPMTYRELIVAIPANTRSLRLIIDMPNSGATFIDDISASLWTLDNASPTMTLGVYQFTDGFIARGEGIVKTIDITY